jgi:ATP-dependent Clp protease adaptor protein ClpS
MVRKKKIPEIFNLIIFNNDKLSFIEIILILKSIGLMELQANQCAMLIHNKGKYAAVSGEYDEMKSIQANLTEYGVKSEIEPKINKTINKNKT